MIKSYNPDIILIACNTLSVIYPKTKFSQTTQVPVFGIVEFGVEMIVEKMKTELNSSLIILGTETTILSNMHKNKLIQSGISSERISSFACKYLESEIQADPNSDIVKNLIEYYTTEALDSVSNKSEKIFLGLCCTHYGYCLDVFKQTLEESGVKNFEIVDPNNRMMQFLSLPKYFDRFNKSLVNVEVVSRSVINDVEKESIGNALKRVSEKTSRALKEYKLKKDLFYFEAK
jgi:glutamate racemase